VPAGTAVATKSGNSLSSQVKLGSATLEQFGSMVMGSQPLASGATVTSSSNSSWMLSANTQLVITGTINLDVSIHPENYVGTFNLGYQANGGYNLTLLTGEGTSQQQVDAISNSLTAQLAFSTSSPDLLQASQSRSFTLTVNNTSSKSLLVSLGLNEYVSGYYSKATSAVPEPGTFAFMGLGLGLIAWRTRGRRG
jgi:hypothetical protein